MSDIKWVLLADQVDYGQGLNVAVLQFGGKEQAVVHLHSEAPK